MESQSVWPQVPGQAGEVLLLTANAGRARRQQLEEWLAAQAGARPAETWSLSCERNEGGPWAGVAAWLAELVPLIQAEAPDLIVSHDYELAYVLPGLRRTLPVRNPTLTDIAPDHERVRNYPMDRAFRIGHGLINLLDEWRRRSGDKRPWVVACDSFDRTGVLAQRFFADLARRRGKSLGLTLLLAAAPESYPRLVERMPSLGSATRVAVDLPADAPVPVDPAEMRRLAEALEAQVGEDQIEREMQMPRLLGYWRQSDRPQNGLRWLSWIFSVYTTRGMYEDALVYGMKALELLNRYEPENLMRRWSIVGKIHSCHVGLNRAEEVHHLLVDLIERTADPGVRFRGSSMMGIVYARYMSQKDMQKAEEWLERGYAEIEQSDLSDLDRVFFRVFNRNGLALVRHRQGRATEAIELCRSGYELLDAQLKPGEHKLHRSVLLYNIAQVYATTGHLEEAIAYITAAMEMDPNYSEYYNDRGNWRLKLGQVEAALSDYRQAIKLSPPYPEVLANLGNCCRKLGRLTEAVQAYSDCLDLTPGDTMARVGRGEAHEALGMTEEAIADYTAALNLRPNLAEVLANRAILLFERGRVAEALADLDQAIALMPASPELYYNRATAQKALQRERDALQDLQTCLALTRDPEERSAVKSEIQALSAALGA